MKRFFTIFLCSIIIATIFIVPFSANAEETLSDSLLGVWEFNGAMSRPSQSNVTIEDSFSFAVFDDSGTKYLKSGMTVIVGANRLVSYVYYDSDTVYSSNYWGINTYNPNTVTILTEPTNATFITWFKSQFTKVADLQTECDGSTCPTTDVNNDDVCDDCGLPFIYSLRDDTYYNYYGSYYPKLPNYDTSTYQFAFIYDNPSLDAPSLYVSTENVYVDNGVVKFKYDGTYLTYNFHNDQWIYVNKTDYEADTTVITNSDHLLWSNNDVYKSDDTIFLGGDPNFQIPLWEKVEQVTQGAITNFQTITGGNLMILTLCGVGLLTLLMGLLILLKVLRNYLPK